MKKFLASRYIYFFTAVLIAVVFGAVFLDVAEFISETNPLAYTVCEYDDDAKEHDHSGRDITSCLGGCQQAAIARHSKSTASKRTSNSLSLAVTGQHISTLIAASPGLPRLADSLRSYDPSFSFSGLSPPFIS